MYNRPQPYQIFRQLKLANGRFNTNISIEISNLVVDPVQLLVLPLDLAAHVLGHVLQVAQHGTDGLHVVLHLVLTSVVIDAPDVRTCDEKSSCNGVHSVDNEAPSDVNTSLDGTTYLE